VRVATTSKSTKKPAPVPAAPAAKSLFVRRGTAPAGGEITTAARAAVLARPRARKPKEDPKPAPGKKSKRTKEHDEDLKRLLEAADAEPVTSRNRPAAPAKPVKGAKARKAPTLVKPPDEDDTEYAPQGAEGEDGELEAILRTANRPTEVDLDRDEGESFVRMLSPDERVVPVSNKLVINKLLNGFLFIREEPAVPRFRGNLDVCDRAKVRGWYPAPRRTPLAIISKVDACQVYLGAMVGDARNMDRRDKNFDFAAITRLSKFVKNEEKFNEGVSANFNPLPPRKPVHHP
jgi:hypothetical protein